MKRILMVFNDVILLSSFKRWVSHSSPMQTLLFAKDGKKALEIISTSPVDLLITQLNLPEMDGLELMAEMSCLCPTIKIAFFLPPYLTIDSQELAQLSLSSFYFILKPNSIKEFSHFVGIGCLNVAEFQALPITDIPLAHFLQLIAFQKKTCALEIENSVSQKKAMVYFKAGVLYDASCAAEKAITSLIELKSYLSVDLNLVCEELNSSAAMTELLTWTRVKMRFKPCDEKKMQHTLHATLSDFIK